MQNDENSPNYTVTENRKFAVTAFEKFITMLSKIVHFFESFFD